MNKKIVIFIISAVVVLLIGAGLGVYFLVIKPQNQTANNNTPGTGGANRANFANFSNISGKVLSVSATDMIVDAGTSQSDIVWDSSTRVTGNTTSPQATVLAVGNTVTVRLKDASGSNIATSVTKVDLSASNFGGANGGTPVAGGANGGNFRRGGGNANSQGGSSGSNGVVRPTQRTSYVGTVVAVNGNSLTINVNAFGGFGGNPNASGTPGAANGTSGTPSATPTSMTIDISSAVFSITETKAVSDIKQGDTLQVTGQVQANQQVLARSIVIQ